MKAQDDYYPLVDTNRVWAIYDGYSSFEYRIKDTLIHNDTIYHTLYRNNSIIGLIREDSTRKVYYRRLSIYGNEELLYDFNFIEGDTIEYYRLWGTFVVDLVDTVEFVNGSKRKRWTLLELYGWDEVVYWIEGIGTLNRDLLNPGAHDGGTYYTTLLCCHEHEELVYMNPNYDTCYIAPNNIEEIIELKHIVTPNPAADKLFIKSQYIYQIKIFNIHGKLLLNKIIREADVIDIDISHLPPGLIIVRLHTTSNEIINYKIIKI
jgi:hypothetical protein